MVRKNDWNGANKSSKLKHWASKECFFEMLMDFGKLVFVIFFVLAKGGPRNKQIRSRAVLNREVLAAPEKAWTKTPPGVHPQNKAKIVNPWGTPAERVNQPRNITIYGISFLRFWSKHRHSGLRLLLDLLIFVRPCSARVSLKVGSFWQPFWFDLGCYGYLWGSKLALETSFRHPNLLNLPSKTIFLCNRNGQLLIV